MIFDGKLEVGYHYRNQKNFLNHISFVIHNIPSDIRKTICENCIVIITGVNYGEHFGKTEKEIIIINWSQILIEGIHWKQIRHIIAHEFAHYILNHKKLTKAEQKVIGVDQEKEADELATKWGFPPYENKK